MEEGDGEEFEPEGERWTGCGRSGWRERWTGEGEEQEEHADHDDGGVRRGSGRSKDGVSGVLFGLV